MTTTIETCYAIELLKPGEPMLAFSTHGGPLLFQSHRAAAKFQRELRRHLVSRSRIVKLEVTLRPFPAAEKALSA